MNVGYNRDATVGYDVLSSLYISNQTIQVVETSVMDEIYSTSYKQIQVCKYDKFIDP